MSNLRAPGAATFGPALGINGVVTNLNSAIGTQPTDVLSAAPRLTGLNEILVATRQNRVLRFQQTDFQPPMIVPGDMTVQAPDAVGPVTVTFPTIATDNVGLSTSSCLPASGSDFPHRAHVGDVHGKRHFYGQHRHEDVHGHGRACRRGSTGAGSCPARSPWELLQGRQLKPCLSP